MGNNESVVCGKKNPKKSSTAENNEEQQLEDAEDEEQVSLSLHFSLLNSLLFLLDGRYRRRCPHCQQ